MIKLISDDQTIPWDLLLLADENTQSIERYIYQCTIYVLERDQKNIAVYAWQELDSDTVEIKNIAVDPAYQGQGIGQRMLHDAIDRARNAGYKQIRIGTGDACVKQLYIYQKVGFEMFEIKHRFFLDLFPEPIYENGIQLKHTIVLKKDLV